MGHTESDSTDETKKKRTVIEAIQRKALTQRGVSLDPFLSAQIYSVDIFAQALLVTKQVALVTTLELKTIPATVSYYLLGKRDHSHPGRTHRLSA